MTTKNITWESIKETLNNKVLPELMPITDWVKKRVPNNQAIQDSIWGQVYLAPWEVALLDTPLMQRMRQIHQLGSAFFVYPSAIHDRFSHSLGVAFLAESLVNSLQNKIRYKIISLSPEDREVITLKDTYTIKLAGLLHDIGHCLFSHCSEFVLKSLWDKIYYSDFAEILPIKPATHEFTGYMIITSEYFRKYWDIIIKPIFFAHNVSEEDIPNLDDIAKAITGNFISPEKRFITEIINGPYDVDKIDYMQRDSKTAGISISCDPERYFSKIILHKQKNSEDLTIWRLAMKLEGVHVAEQMLISKMMLFPYIFQHNKVLASEFLVCNILEKLVEGKSTNTIKIKNPIELLLYTDDDLLCFSCHSKDEVLNRQIKCLRERIFPRIAFALNKNVCFNQNSSEFKRNFIKIRQFAKTRDKRFRRYVANYLSKRAIEVGYSPISKDEVEIFFSRGRSVIDKMGNAPVINYTEKMEKIKDRWLMRNWDSSSTSDNDIIYFYVPAPYMRFAFEVIADLLKERFHFEIDLDKVREIIKLKHKKIK